MVDNIQGHVKSLNFGYRVALLEEKVEYKNEYAEFEDAHTIKGTNKKGVVKHYTSDKFIIATGERPRYPTDCPGAIEYSISSDDLFSLPYAPGKTLVIGASYVALECAGFLIGLGYDTTVAVRSIFLRGFDQEIAEKIGAYMETEGVKFLRPALPTKIERLEEGTPGKYKVTFKKDSGEETTDEFNTILFAIGRDPCTDKIGLEKAGVMKNPKSGKIKVDEKEQTNIENIYAVGDILQGKLELTPVAIEAGQLLAQRLFGGKKDLTDYVNVPTTVFTPLEYGAVGLSEEAAVEQFGPDNVEIYIQQFTPLEWTVPHRPDGVCYAKLITLINDNVSVFMKHDSIHLLITKLNFVVIIRRKSSASTILVPTRAR